MKRRVAGSRYDLESFRQGRRFDPAESLLWPEPLASPEESRHPCDVPDRSRLQSVGRQLGIELGRGAFRRARREERGVERVGPPPLIARHEEERPWKRGIVAAVIDVQM